MDKILGKDIIILDGAMGTMLQKAGLKTGESPLVMNLRAPDVVKKLHQSYLDAGTNIICSNTFAASEAFGKGEDVSQSFAEAIKIAKEAAAPYGALVAADIGPIGRLLAPMGNLSPDEAWEILAKQCILASDAGADIIYFETMTDILESKIGVLAAKELTSLPVFASMSFEQTGKTFLGCSLWSMALTLTAAGADALGINCSVGPKEAYAMAQEIVKWTDLPVIIKPNAGLPKTENGATVYDVTPDEFSELMAALPALGVSLMGGCCGTSPQFISSLAKAVDGAEIGQRPTPNTNAVCSSSEVFDGNGTFDHCLDCMSDDEVKEAYDDIDQLTELALDSEDDAIVVCVDGLENPYELLKSVVTEIQNVCRKPLVFRSSDADLVEFIDRYYRGKIR